MAKKPRTQTPPRPVQAPKRRDDPRKRSLPAVDRRKWMLGGLIATVVIVAIVLGVVLTTGGSSSNASSGGYTDKVNFAALPNLHSGPPPWDNGSAFLADRLAGVHLTALAQEALAFHIHQHLDLYVKGKKVTLPPGVGFTNDGNVTELHTHDPTGLIHVESPVDRPYSLGQLFGEWGVWLSPTRIGDYRGKVQWWVNGKKQTGNPAALGLKPHQEIVVVVGQPPLVVPKSYKFPAGT